MIDGYDARQYSYPRQRIFTEYSIENKTMKELSREIKHPLIFNYDMIHIHNYVNCDHSL